MTVTLDLEIMEIKYGSMNFKIYRQGFLVFEKLVYTIIPLPLRMSLFINDLENKVIESLEEKLLTTRVIPITEYSGST